MSIGVLVMAHGTPSSPEGIAPFYTRIRRGRPPDDAQLAELEARYRAIGGASPLSERTSAQVGALRRTLDARAPGRFTVAFGAKHTEPFIEEAAASLAASGAERVLGLVLTPHGSSMGSHEYQDRAAAALVPRHIPFVALGPWYSEPALVALLATRVREACAAMPGRVVADAGVSTGVHGVRGEEADTVGVWTRHELSSRKRGRSGTRRGRTPVRIMTPPQQGQTAGPHTRA